MPALLAAPVAGSLVDRYDRARVVALSCALATVGFGVAAVLVIDDKPLWSLAVATAAASAVATPPRPALKTLLPALARTPAELVRATAHWTGVDSAGFLFGAGAGGILIALTATGAVVAIAAGLAALTTLLAVGLPATIASEASEETDDAGLLVGVRGVLATPPLYAPFVLLIGLLVLEGATDVQLVALAIDRLGLVTAVAGATVISAGSTGDAFFVVDTGVLDVVEYDRRLGPGDGFEEISLLRDVARTATIRAHSGAELWAVDRAPFLAALGASPDARTAASGVIDEHLARRPTRAGEAGSTES